VLRKVGRTVVMVQNNKTPTDEEWSELLRLIAENPTGVRILVLTDGGAPSPAQRRRLQETLGGAEPLVAAVSDNMKTRFVAATIALFHSTHVSCTRAEIRKAYDHLQLTPAERKLVEVAAQQMHEMLL
jgi:hypothetical protein